MRSLTIMRNLPEDLADFTVVFCNTNRRSVLRSKHISAARASQLVQKLSRAETVKCIPFPRYVVNHSGSISLRFQIDRPEPDPKHKELARLKEAIREGASRRDLLRMVGPSPEEKEMQLVNVQRLNSIDLDKEPERWRRAMDRCAAYEDRYL